MYTLCLKKLMQLLSYPSLKQVETLQIQFFISCSIMASKQPGP